MALLALALVGFRSGWSFRFRSGGLRRRWHQRDAAGRNDWPAEGHRQVAGRWSPCLPAAPIKFVSGNPAVLAPAPDFLVGGQALAAQPSITPVFVAAPAPQFSHLKHSFVPRPGDGYRPSAAARRVDWIFRDATYTSRHSKRSRALPRQPRFSLSRQSSASAPFIGPLPKRFAWRGRPRWCSASSLPFRPPICWWCLSHGLRGGDGPGEPV